MSGNIGIGSPNRATGTVGWIVSSSLTGCTHPPDVPIRKVQREDCPSAGRLDWPMAWVHTPVSAVNARLPVMVVSPELMKERAHPRADAKAWDQALAHLTGPDVPIRLGSTAMLIVAELDSCPGGRGSVLHPRSHGVGRQDTLVRIGWLQGSCRAGTPPLAAGCVVRTRYRTQDEKCATRSTRLCLAMG